CAAQRRVAARRSLPDASDGRAARFGQEGLPRSVTRCRGKVIVRRGGGRRRAFAPDSAESFAAREEYALLDRLHAGGAAQRPVQQVHATAKNGPATFVRGAKREELSWYVATAALDQVVASRQATSVQAQ